MMEKKAIQAHIPAHITSQGGGEKQAQGGRKVLKMVQNERMGGSVPAWEKPVSAAQIVEEKLTAAQTGTSQPDFEALLAYQAEGDYGTHSSGSHSYQSSEEFGFGDLIDMVNPLHHIPVVGHIYRSVTGDEIKPIGNIIGGAVFGGPLGAASGLVNTVIQEETGKDLAGNAMAMVLSGQAPSLKSRGGDNPEARLNAVVRQAEQEAYSDLPASLLSFTDMGHAASRKSGFVVERISDQAASGRTAGYSMQVFYRDLEAQPLPAREPITQVRFQNRY